MYAKSLASSIRDFVHSFEGNEAMLHRLVHNISDQEKMARDGTDLYSGNHTNITFCGVLTWCTPAGVTQCDMTYRQRFLMHRVLQSAVSPAGYQTLVAITNRQKVIGELESSVSPECHERLAEVLQHWEGLKVFLPENASLWEAGELAGVDLSGCAYLPLAGAGLANDTPPSVGPQRFKDAVVDWLWRRSPDFDGRRGQFCNYSIAIFMEDPRELKEGDRFGFWFEGHHTSLRINVHFEPDGSVRLDSTPLFLGAFPMVNPPVADTASARVDNTTELRGYSLSAKWMEAQSIMLICLRHVRDFWQGLPKAVRDAAYINASFFAESPPFRKIIPNEFQFIAGLYPDREAGSQLERALHGLPHITVSSSAIPMEARWHLIRALEAYLGLMHKDVEHDYLERIRTEMSSPNGSLTLSTAGGPLEDHYSPFMSYVQIGPARGRPMLMETYQTPEWSVQTNATRSVIANHVHSVFRDMDFAWPRNDPLRGHLRAHHDHGHSHGGHSHR